MAVHRNPLQDQGVPVVSSAHFLIGPLVAGCALGLIALICRWVFSTDDRDRRRVEKAIGSRQDLGLLVTVAATRSRDDAEMLRDVLREAGVRASISEDELECHVLVFAKDADAARRLVGTSST
ncbi:MAG: hypothetical protein JWO22_2807 [Frankiales bacterium]|nr:hypothetical protein [Frankiales bacterium]